MIRGKTFRVGLYARVSTQDQQTLPMQLAAARKAGKAHGRPITIQKYLPEIRRLHAAGTSKREIAKRLKIARTSVRRLLEASRTRRRPVLARPRKAA